MPIRPENKARYPENWAEIRAAVLVRAGHRCEHAGCGVPNYAVGWWRLVPSTGPVWEPVTGHAQPASRARVAEQGVAGKEQGVHGPRHADEVMPRPSARCASYNRAHV